MLKHTNDKFIWMPFTSENYQAACEFFKERDPLIGQLLQKHGYLPPPAKRDLYPLLIGTIIGQRIRFAIARKLRAQLYIKLGTDNFSPENIDHLGSAGLTEIGIGQPQVQAILGVNQYLRDSALTLSHPSQLLALKEVKGIGDWTISCTRIMFSLNSEDCEFDDTLLTSDLIIRRGIKTLYGTGLESQMLTLSQRWSPWRGIVTWYLWKEFS